VSGPAALGSLAGLNFTAEESEYAEVGTPGMIRAGGGVFVGASQFSLL